MTEVGGNSRLTTRGGRSYWSAVAAIASMLGLAISMAALRRLQEKPPLPTSSSESTDADESADSEGPRGYGQGLQGLTRDLLVQRSIDSSASIYLTVISIIQGAAFALVVERVRASLDARALVDSLVVQCLAIFLNAILILHAYTVSTIFFRWPPSVIDPLTPFVFGSLQVPSILAIGWPLPGAHASWNLAIVIFWAGAAFLFFLSTIWTGSTHFGESTSAYKQSARMFIDLEIISLLVAAICGYYTWRSFTFLEVFDRWRLPFVDHPGGPVALASILGTCAAITTIEYRTTKIYAEYSVPRRMFG